MKNYDSYTDTHTKESSACHYICMERREAYPLYEIYQDQFPTGLIEIPDPPKKLFVRGTLPPKENKLLAIVGSRNYSSYGKEVVAHLVGGLRGYPITIISGLALGIDGLAHKSALEQNLHTIAVPGSGLSDEVLYPRTNKHLAKEILKSGGGMLSEFEPDFRATQWSFPQRNRIMAGISHAVLVIEATQKSGTLITSRLATDYNRDVLTVPNSFFSKNAEGPHMLIKLGAVPVTSADDILYTLGISANESPTKETKGSFSKIEQKLLALLSEPHTHDEIIRALDTEAGEANVLLMTMELKGYIKKTGDRYIGK